MREPIESDDTKPIRWVGGVVAFVAGAALAVVAFLWRRQAAQLEETGAHFIWVTALALGFLATILTQIGRGLMSGKSLYAATGADESRKTSKVTLVMAGLLFVPFWGVSLMMVVGSFSPGSSLERLAAWSSISAFMSLLVFGLVREWRR